MYHVVIGIATDDAQARAKAKVVADLPGESVSATIVHADDEADLLSIPSISDVHDHLIDHGVDVSLLAIDGTPSNVILETAEREDADLICIGGRHHSPAGKMQMRIGAEAIILNTNRPVLIAGQGKETTDSPFTLDPISQSNSNKKNEHEQ